MKDILNLLLALCVNTQGAHSYTHTRGRRPIFPLTIMVLIGTSGSTVIATGIKQAPCSTILCVFLTMGPRKVFWDSHWRTGRWVGLTDYVGIGVKSAIPKEGRVRQMRLPYLDGKV